MLKHHRLFKGLTQEEFTTLQEQFNYKTYKKGTTLFQMGDIIEDIYIIVGGSVEICSYDMQGNKKLVTILNEHDMFAESVALADDHITPFDIIAIRELKVLQLSKESILNANPKLLLNLLEIVATKNTFLTHKIECLNKANIRERVYELLNFYCIKKRSLVIELPFNKTQLAEYLCVNRSSLSRELHHMEQEGIFTIRKRVYKLNSMYFNI